MNVSQILLTTVENYHPFQIGFLGKSKEDIILNTFLEEIIMKAMKKTTKFWTSSKRGGGSAVIF